MSDTTVRLINLTDIAVITEEELLDRAREGDKTAFGALYLRHRDAARKVAGMCASSSADAEDAVAEGFARVFAALPRMAGRDISFRPYLLTAVRNAATDRLRRERRVDLRDTVPDGPTSLTADDVALLGLERNLVGEALQALPSRWRTVLWLTEVEGLSPAEVSRRIGIKPNAVAALAYRARKGLREAYLQAHLRSEASEECRTTVSRLSHYVRGELPDKERLGLQAHLDACAKCRCRRDELTDVNATLRNAFLPVPLLLAGMQRGWMRFFDTGSLWSHAPDVAQVAQVAQVAEAPLAHKTLAGITMMVLALTGAAVPAVINDNKPAPKVEVAAARPQDRPAVLRVVPGRPDPAMLSVIPVSGGKSSSSNTETAAAPAPAAADQASADGGSRHRLLPRFGGTPSEGSGRPGDTRQRLLRPPGTGEDGSGSDGGILPGTPVGDVISATLGTAEDAAAAVGVDLAEAVPIGVAVTTPAPDADGAASGAEAPLGVEVTVSLPDVPVDGGRESVTGLAPVAGRLGIRVD
ncbi:MAG: sigma-70 family RNA polymerase sigma factor [Actinomycetota bacterium]|nr:sigma-70 family RNA polymerase sigma factor [Actinomycetota bacterium]